MSSRLASPPRSARRTRSSTSCPPRSASASSASRRAPTRVLAPTTDRGCDPPGDRRAARDRRDRDRRRARGRRADAPARGEGRAAAPRSCCSPTAPPTPARTRSAVARAAARHEISIDTVALGTPSGVLTSPDPLSPPIPVPPDPQLMRQIAHASHGHFFTAQDAGRLNSIYRGLGTALSSRPDRARPDPGVRRRRAGAAAGGDVRVDALGHAAAVSPPQSSRS